LCFATNPRSANLRALILVARTQRKRYTGGAHDRSLAFSQGAVRSHPTLLARSLTHTHAQSSANESTWAVCNNVQCVCVLRRRRPRRFIVIVCFAGLSPTRAVFAQCMGVIFYPFLGAL
jgi:hypothetical protein